jgi:N-acetylmuramoyl-L-alanine amidase
LEHGASVNVIVRDPNDGIRDEQFLECDNDEIYLGDIAIPADQLSRLSKRCDIVNELYKKNKKSAKSQQVVFIHVDSRSVGKRIDIFFYYSLGSDAGSKIANTLHETIGEKYGKAQPGRGYHGTVTSRNLYVLRNTLPPAVFLELGNIRNSLDQLRFLVVNNRQAMANWICDGLIEAAGK